MATTKIIQTDDEKFMSVDRLAWTYHRVPPTNIFRIILIIARYMMIAGKCMADQDGIGFIAV